MKKTKKFSRNYRIAAGITVVMLLVCCGLFVGILKGQPASEEFLTEKEKNSRRIGR